MTKNKTSAEPIHRKVIRRSDCDPSIFISIIEGDESDINVLIGCDGEMGSYTVNFARSGSQSPKTREAFIKLIDAIQEEETHHE